MKFGIDWPSVSEKKMFENNGYIHVYSPGAGTDNSLWSFFFHKQYYSVNSHLLQVLTPLNDFVTVFPIQTYRQPNLTLP